MNPTENEDKSDNKRRFVPPSEFMRGRRPDEYSDSDVARRPLLDRSLLEYHLDTLGNRSQEKEFEHFARRLSEKTICPNLIPQTGSTGGGDSKADTETYPVSEVIAERWYVGEITAGSERWAFAFSTQKDWRTKVRNDVQGIADTERGYARIYYISSQFIRDKDRAAVEDKLTADVGIQIRILDRSWIVDRVIQDDHIALAIQALHIGELSPEGAPKLGSKDASRKAALDELESDISNPERYEHVEFQLVEDCLDAAVISRELQRPRSELDGRFDRARRLAKKYGSTRQQLRALYQHAWTACYWYDDFSLMIDHFSEIVELARLADDTNSFEMPMNVFNTLKYLSSSEYATDSKVDIEQYYQELSQLIGPSIEDDRHPNRAMHGRVLMLLIDQLHFIDDEARVRSILAEWKSVFRKGDLLGEFPFEHFADIFQNFGNIFGRYEGYDEAFEEMLPRLERRSSEVSGGQALLRRGKQKLADGQIYEAIHTLGRAIQRLIKYDQRDELVQSLALLASAYDEAGLLWAAHNCILTATSMTLRRLVVEDQRDDMSLSCLMNLAYVNCGLGRVTETLLCLEIADVVSQSIGLHEEGLEKYQSHRTQLDWSLGAMMTKVTLEQLTTLPVLVESLERLSLHAASSAVIVMLGHADKLAAEGYVEAGTSVDEIDESYASLARQAVEQGVPAPALPNNLGVVVLRSEVLGMEWQFHVEATELTMRAAEAVIGAIEAIFATSLADDSMPHRQRVRIDVVSQPDGTDGKALRWAFGDGGKTLLTVSISQKFDPFAKLEEQILENFLFDLIANLIPKTLMLPEPEKYLERVAGQEEGFRRSLTFCNTFIARSNVFGQIDETPSKTEGESRYLPRMDVVRARLSAEASRAEQSPITPLEFGVGEPPKALCETERMRHGDRKVFSVIDVDDWDAADWGGIGVIQLPAPPIIMALLFREKAGACRIFEKWRHRFGEVDEHEEMRVAVIKGIDAEKHDHYAVHISTRFEAVKDQFKKDGQGVFVSRINTMRPTSPQNLDLLVRAVNEIGAFRLLPAILCKDGGEPQIMWNLSIIKKTLVVRNAWEIGEHDPDIPVVSEISNPVIPATVVKAPIIAAMARRARCR